MEVGVNLGAEVGAKEGLGWEVGSIGTDTETVDGGDRRNEDEVKWAQANGEVASACMKQV